MSKSKIDWTDKTWPVVTGCSPVSRGCRHCWAARNAAGRLRNHPFYEGLTLPWDPPAWTGEVRVNEEVFGHPLRWRKRSKVFVAATGDLFHHAVPTATITKVFEVMAQCPHHTFQVLTKRPERMRDLVEYWQAGRSYRHIAHLEHVWLGVSICDQYDEVKMAELDGMDWPHLWANLGPLIGPIDPRVLSVVDWIAMEGESGKHARPCHPKWVNRVVDYWRGRIPIFFKQWGEWLPWGAGDYTRAWLNVDGALSEYNPWVKGAGRIGVIDDVVMVTRVGKKRAGARLIHRDKCLDGQLLQEYPEVMR